MNQFDMALGLVKFLGFLIAIVFHQAAKALAARALGDSSQMTIERASLNPLPHIDVFGTLVIPGALILFGSPFIIGWAKPYHPVTRYLKNIKRDLNLVYLAAPGINFLIAILCVLSLKFLAPSSMMMPSAEMDASQMASLFLFQILISNMVIGLMSFLPMMGLTGWVLLENNLKFDLAQKFQRYAIYINYFFLFLLVMGIFNPIFSIAINLVLRLI